MHPHPSQSITDKLEETLIAVILGLMTMITFINVIVRKAFANDPPALIEWIKLENIGLWGNELTVLMFAWLGLLGASYAVKKNAHLGVDAVINMLSAPVRRILALVAVAVCLVYAFLLLKGSWDYWANFANLPATEGRWFPTGFEDKFREKGWYAMESVPMPGMLAWMADVFNDGEPYEKLPRLVPYFALPLSMALLLFRFAQVAVAIWQGKMDRIVASHEVEDEIQEMREQRGEFDT
ncbi:2,3-diketo-L-gulonate TRAP transporter small permease protein YiaM [Roseovarius litorisediminis]|uniref:TRAP transporter small permease protein n=1 Tax=Roseovarius litorisediminis TaxID=1312363 RepID=A0A1Y5TAZ4_9RHOB|nr:TRAP transporter small permease [Roseovarius litorisediminis]SLN59479.1 2,3-diketo-L-gulonate TRAP transporter small permease protein YiaM [Roseovarius litorisediminis]